MSNPSASKHSLNSSIPSDWDTVELKGVCKKITDGTHNTPTPINEGIPFLTALHVKEELIDFDNCYYLPEVIHKEIYRRCNPERDDVLMVNIGAGVATTALVNVDYEFSLKNVALLKPNTSKLLGPYLNYYQIFIKPKLIQNLLNGGAQPFLSLKQIQKLKVSLPPLPEQRAIAACLSTWDKAITNLQTTITLKEQQKKWLMQQLLTGRKRLKGFSGDWKEVRLGNSGKFSKGKGITKEQLSSKGLPCIRYGEIYTTHDFVIKKFKSFISEAVAKESIEIKKGDILFAGSGETLDEIGKAVAFIGDEKAYAGGDVIILRPNKYINSLFLAYTLETNEVKSQKRELGQGHSVVHIYPSDLTDITISLPELKEQTAIAQVLQAADKEIQQLKAKLAQLKEQKKGLMQVLLTGGKRLKTKI